MGAAQTHNTEDHQVALPNNPFVPPQGDTCYINNLPPEILSRIFEIGSADDNEDEDDLEADFWESLRDHFDVKEADDGKDTEDSDVGMDAESSEEGETGEDTKSNSTDSSSFPSPWPSFPMLVSHVCRHWRNVAFATPSLWTTIVVTPEARPPYEPVSMLLERSKGLPIDIFVDCEPHDHGFDLELPSDVDLRHLYSLLVPHVHRWHTMEVSVAEYHHMYVFLSAVSDSSISSAPQLTTLQLYHREETEEFDSFGYPSMSKHLTLFGGLAPSLTKLLLWGVHVDWNQPWIASASKLTDLELAYHSEDVRPSWAQFITILRGAPALERLSLQLSGPSGEPPEWIIPPTIENPTDLNAPVPLTRVTNFVLAFHSQARAIGLIQKLCLPELKDLVLDFDNGDYTDFVHELAGSATSLSPAQEQPRSLLSKLDTLKIAGLPCRPECIPELYGELQNLTSLDISLSYLCEHFLDILSTPCTVPGLGDIWLPRLVTLRVYGASGEAIRQVVRTRKDAGFPLTSLYVEKSCQVDNEDVEWLNENVDMFQFFEGSDDEDDIFEDLNEEADEWSDED